MDLNIKNNYTENLADKGYSVQGLIAYQDGSVVSRTIIKKKVGTVTLFAFDKGEGLSEHTAPFDALIQVVDGTAMITISGNESIVKEGELIMLPEGEPHAVHAETKFKMVLTMIRSAE